MSSHSSSAASKASSDSKVMMSYKVKLPSTIQDFAMMIDSKTISFDSINSHHNLIPKLQEAYYQFKHSQFRHEQYEDVVNYSTSWKIGRQAYSSVDHKVYKIESMHHCYATIAPTLNLSDTTIAHKFYEAIAQCRIAKKEGQSGIKIFYNVVELKINDSDSRLIAKAYKNTKGGVLFVFDEIKTHQEIKKMAEMRSILNLNPCEMIDKINYQNSDYLQKDLENAQTCYAQILGEYAKNLEIEIEI